MIRTRLVPMTTGDTNITGEKIKTFTKIKTNVFFA